MRAFRRVGWFAGVRSVVGAGRLDLAGVRHFLHAHGYGPQHSVTGDAISKTDWEECTECSTRPGYRGGPVSMAKHKRMYHRPDKQ